MKERVRRHTHTRVSMMRYCLEELVLTKKSMPIRRILIGNRIKPNIFARFFSSSSLSISRLQYQCESFFPVFCSSNEQSTRSNSKVRDEREAEKSKQVNAWKDLHFAFVIFRRDWICYCLLRHLFFRRACSRKTNTDRRPFF